MEIKITARARLPSRFGSFDIYGFSPSPDGKEHVAIAMGDLNDDQEPISIRIHSECLTGDSLGSLRCDCGPQLQKSMRLIASESRGVILYLRQEGRGIGLSNKIRAYSLQDKGMDTYEANVSLGFKPDERNFDVAVDMLKALGVSRVRLMTNNPEKLRALRAGGIIVSRASLCTKINSYNRKYMETKKRKLGHLL